MTETESRIGKRYCMLDDKHGVPPGTTGTVINSMRVGKLAPFMAAGIGAKLPEPTVDVWMLDIQCDDPAKTVISVDERDESIERPPAEPVKRGA